MSDPTALMLTTEDGKTLTCNLEHVHRHSSGAEVRQKGASASYDLSPASVILTFSSATEAMKVLQFLWVDALHQKVTWTRDSRASAAVVADQ